MTQHWPLRAFQFAILAALSGCSDALIYSESSSFNLAIGVNDSAALPISVNAGLKRSVVNIAPPLGGDVTNGSTVIPQGEAVSSVSSFVLTDSDRGTNPLAGTLKIKTQFASGNAAVTISGKPALTEFILKGRFIKDSPTKAKLNEWLGNPRDLGRVAALEACNDQRNPAIKGASLGILLNSEGNEAQRTNIVNCLGL